MKYHKSRARYVWEVFIADRFRLSLSPFLSLSLSLSFLDSTSFPRLILITKFPVIKFY